MNQDIRKLVDKYDLSSYICTDPDCQQYGRKESNYCWHYIQCVDDGPFNAVVSATIDLHDYKEREIERCINTYGYTILGDNRFVDIKKEYRYNWQQLCCECLFEEMIPELLS